MNDSIAWSSTPEQLLDEVAALRRTRSGQDRRLLAERLVFADQNVQMLEKLRQANESIAAHGAVMAAQERALLEQQQSIASLHASVAILTAELERAREVFAGTQAYVSSLESRLAEEHAGRSATEAELASIRASRMLRWTAPARAAMGPLLRLNRVSR